MAKLNRASREAERAESSKKERDAGRSCLCTHGVFAFARCSPARSRFLHIRPICSKLFLCEIFNFDKLGRKPRPAFASPPPAPFTGPMALQCPDASIKQFLDKLVYWEQLNAHVDADKPSKLNGLDMQTVQAGKNCSSTFNSLLNARCSMLADRVAPAAHART